MSLTLYPPVCSNVHLHLPAPPCRPIDFDILLPYALQTLFEVEGTNVYRESLDVVAQLLLGEPGTKVRLLFLRGTRVFIEANIERQTNSRQVMATQISPAGFDACVAV